MKERIGSRLEEKTDPEKYSLDGLSIEVCEPADLREKLGIDWPLELNGKGTVNEADKSMLVRYPRGDIFLSNITTIHELGHLRQRELDPSLDFEERDHDALTVEETDAWQRGWKRLLKAAPEELAKLEERFRSFKQFEGREQNSFEKLYWWIAKNALKIVEMQKVLFENGLSEDDKYKALAKKFEEQGVKEFVKEYCTFRVGEIVDEEIINLIRKIVRLIITEVP